MNKRVVKISIEQADGTVYYTEYPADIQTILLALGPLKVQYKKTAGIARLRNKYFTMVTELERSVNTGYGKTGLHTALKGLILPKFAEMPHYFTNGQPERSTTKLNAHGWDALLEELRVVANDIWNYSFKN